ncbi:hypothetical protein [Pseudomonas fulva]|uniref:hypothetical protein n=1 Tax=Pseudomonas fulva TaxID=47880 RepID=UPI0018A9ED55|nr:hypothetical protein [Pseudomonas fulva]MBF8775226.1 hypothetical protein [Pseudomonas fulva]
MALRSELMPPRLDEKLVSKLTNLSEEIDCGERDLTEHMVLEFNQLASTSFDFLDFQGIYGGQDHDTWVRKVLYEPYIKPVADVTTDELVEMMRSVMECEGAEHEVDFWLFMLEVNVPNKRLVDLIFRPRVYFADPDFSQELSPEQAVYLAMNTTAVADG